MLLIIILYALFASSFSLGKVILSYTSPIFLTGIRMSLAGIILLTYCFITKRKFRIARGDLWLFAQIALFGVYVSYILRFWGMEYLTSTKTSFIFNLSPFISALYSHWFFKERITKKQWLGLMIGFIGMIPILLTTTPLETFVGEISFLSWPELAVIGAVCTQSYGWIIVRKLIRHKQYHPLMVSGITMGLGGFLALATCPFTEGFYPVSNSGVFFGLLAIIIIISNIICHNLYAYLLTYYTNTFLAFAGFVTPFFTAFYGRILLNEPITPHFYVSSIIVFIGLALFYKDELVVASVESEAN